MFQRRKSIIHWKDEYSQLDSSFKSFLYVCIFVYTNYTSTFSTCSGESAYLYIRRNINPILVVWARSQAAKDIRSQERLRGEAKNDIDHLGHREGIAAQDGVRERVRSEQAEEHQYTKTGISASSEEAELKK